MHFIVVPTNDAYYDIPQTDHTPTSSPLLPSHHSLTENNISTNIYTLADPLEDDYENAASIQRYAGCELCCNHLYLMFPSATHLYIIR